MTIPKVPVPTSRLADGVETLRAVIRLQQTGVVDLRRPDRLLATVRGNKSYGSAATMIMKGAEEYPDAPALTDERGMLTYRELDEQSNALANAMLAQGIPSGSVVGVLARDHRGLVLAISAAGRAGFRLALMNTGFAEPQFAEVARRENVRAMLHDSEFSELLAALPKHIARIVTWVDTGDQVPPGTRTLDQLIATGHRRRPAPPERPGGFIVLTSGTTGLPKGAPRTKVTPLLSALLVDRIPFPRRGSVVIVSPLFHSTGFATWTVATALANRTVVMRRFDAEATLRALAEHRAQLLVAVPTMLHRLLALRAEVRARYDLSALKAILVAGSPLSPELATRVQDTFGEVLYNLYGSTEVGIATIAQPHELRSAPGTVGRPPVTSKIALFDADGGRVTRPHISARVFVRTSAPFEGYTDGRHKDCIDGYLSSGDMGHFDESGLLHIDGRDDDMIVSGGENVYPLEIENLLAARADVDDVAVVGVDDPEFGQRLRAFIVPASGSVVDEQEIKAYVKANLARYKVPREIVVVDELPRNPTGKVVRAKLKDMP
ncbi:AMP-binding protein [Nocardia nova]|uniref:AMP-binding protein n=1 Tax=Nocardia nova TaxID=37330 RepID=UPI000CEA5FA1|nr:acyl-CoA synthetase [Nocardia nova]